MGSMSPTSSLPDTESPCWPCIFQEHFLLRVPPDHLAMGFSSLENPLQFALALPSGAVLFFRQSRGPHSPTPRGHGTGRLALPKKPKCHWVPRNQHLSIPLFSHRVRLPGWLVPFSHFTRRKTGARRAEITLSG